MIALVLSCNLTILEFIVSVYLWVTLFNQTAFIAGYDWAMVEEMAQLCRTLSQPVTFPVRAALVRQSVSELCWLVQQSNR